MLILMNSDTYKTGLTIDYNKIDYFEYIVNTEGDHFGEMVAVSYYPNDSVYKISRTVLNHITRDEYLSILDSISSSQIGLKGLYIPVKALIKIRNKTFSKQLWKYKENGKDKNLTNFIQKIFSETEFLEHELITNEDFLKITDKLYSDIEEYKILKHIYNYNNGCEITEYLVEDYKSGYLGKIKNK